jgi:hypothetical protein
MGKQRSRFAREMRPLLEDIDGLDCFRAASPYHNPLVLHEVAPWGSRYHGLGEPQVLYTALAQPDAKLEHERVLKRHSVSTANITVVLFSMKFSGRVLNIADKDGQQRLQISTDELVDDDVELCNEVARFARTLEVDGILVPSAARLGATNLVVMHDSVPRTVRLV